MGTVVGTWRLKAIIILFLLIFCIYGAYGMFSNITVVNQPYSNNTYFGVNDTTAGWNSSEAGDIGTDFNDMVFGIGDFLTFGNIDNTWARLFMTTFIAICWIVIGYIIFTFIKEFVPFV